MTRTIFVTEKPDGWTASDGRCWPTAAEAERIIRSSAQPGTLIVQWKATTPIGAQVLKAILT